MLKKSELRLGSLDNIAVSVVPHGGPTLLSLVADALGGLPQGVPPHWRRALHAASPEITPDILGPLFTPAFPQIPDCLAMASDLSDVDPSPAALADVPPATLTAELEADFDGRVPAQWRSVVDDPSRFIAGYADVMRSVWTAFSQVRRQARPLLEREVERIGTAVVTGQLDAVLSNLSPRVSLDGSTLLISDPDPSRTDLAGRRIVLVPLISGSRASAFNLDRPDVVWIGYPLPGLGHLWSGLPAPSHPTDRLALILGPLRAAILRQAARAHHMGDVATLVGCSASTATYHCAQLEQAGLLVRERRGRQVRLRRSVRGDALLDAMS